jgi:hypothetical protein
MFSPGNMVPGSGYYNQSQVGVEDPLQSEEKEPEGDRKDQGFVSAIKTANVPAIPHINADLAPDSGL